MANTAKNANVVNTAFMMGHKAISVENVYTHATEDDLSSVTTPSQAVLDEYKKDTDNNINDEELYKMYLELKERYE